MVNIVHKFLLIPVIDGILFKAYVKYKIDWKLLTTIKTINTTLEL